MTVEDIRSCDIRYRNRQQYLWAQGMTGPFHDPDDRLWTTLGGDFILTYRSGGGGEKHYAVPAPLALDCIRALLDSAGKTEEGSGEYQAIVELNGAPVQGADPQLLKALFAQLQEACGEPLGERELYRRVHPIPPLPLPPFRIRAIEQDTLVPQPHPSLPVPRSDTFCSRLDAERGMLELFREGKYYRYRLPRELLAEVDERAGALLGHLLDGYREFNEKGASVRLFGGDALTCYHVDPQAAYELLADLAEKCGEPLEVREPVRAPGSMFPTAPPPVSAPPPEAQAAAEGPFWTCTCGNRNRGRFCTECGARRKE